MAEEKNDLMEKIVSLCKRRGFVFPGSEIYGGLANSWDFGPYGAQMKKNIKDHWWKFFVEQRDDMVGLDAAIVMNPKVWEASGHVGGFNDILSECRSCHKRIRPDQSMTKEQNEKLTKRMLEINALVKNGKNSLELKKDVDKILDDAKDIINESVMCPTCGKKDWAQPTSFNLMFRIAMGVTGDPSESIAYLRPETAQAMFVDFNLIQQTSRKKLPFGVAQIGKAFRNEITPGNFIFRTREFEQMEVEYFFNHEKNDWKELFASLQSNMEEWMKTVGINPAKTHAVDIPDGERAHYSKRTIDFEFDYPFGQKELFGLAYRGDYDLEQHEKMSGQELRYLDPETNEKVRPHVIEPSLGVERGMLAILLSAFEEQQLEGDDVRIVLHLKPEIAPVQVAVFPLMKNKPELVTKAREVFDMLRPHFRCEFDDNGNVGKRYRRQDEIGTPYCVTIDFDSLEDGAVTVRDRDTMQQERVKIEALKQYVTEKM